MTKFEPTLVPGFSAVPRAPTFHRATSALENCSNRLLPGRLLTPRVTLGAVADPRLNEVVAIRLTVVTVPVKVGEARGAANAVVANLLLLSLAAGVGPVGLAVNETIPLQRLITSGESSQTPASS